MKTVFIDESGYTRSDLLNADQPVYALSAVCIDEAEARQIKERMFPEMNSIELKHSKLYGSAKNDDRLIELQHICLNDYKAITYSVYKRYFLCEIFVLCCVTPFCTNIDYGTIEFRRLAIQLAIIENNSYYDVKEVNKILTLFQKLISCSKNTLALSQLFGEFVSVWQHTTDANLRRLCTGFCKMRLEYVESMVKSVDLGAITPTTLFGLLTQLENIVGEPFVLYFDESDKVREYLPLFERLLKTSSNVFHTGSGLQFNLPLTNFQGTCEVDSAQYAGIQFADILAGGAVKMAAVQYGCETRTERLRYGFRVLCLHRQYPLQHFYKPQNDGIDVASDFARLSKVIGNVFSSHESYQLQKKGC